MATDQQLPRSTRGELLQKFLAEFPADNPHKEDAEKLLRSVLPGTLSVSTEPAGASITVYERPIGRTPVSREVFEHKVLVTATLDGYESAEKWAEMTPGKVTEVHLRLKNIQPGILTVSSTPENARLSITAKDGSPPIEGQTPFSRKLTVKTYEVEISAEGYFPEKTVTTLEHGKEKRLSFSLKIMPHGSLLVTTEPQGAKIEIDGRIIGGSPVSADLSVGLHSVKASMAGYHYTAREVRVRAGHKAQVSLSLSLHMGMNPYKKWGHAAFWSGLGLAAFGGLSAYQASSAAKEDKAGDPDAADRSRTWAGLMYTGLFTGGALLTTGLVLWALSPGDEEWFKSPGAQVTLSPSEDGMFFSLSGRW